MWNDVTFCEFCVYVILHNLTVDHSCDIFPITYMYLLCTLLIQVITLTVTQSSIKLFGIRITLLLNFDLHASLDFPNGPLILCSLQLLFCVSPEFRVQRRNTVLLQELCHTMAATILILRLHTSLSITNYGYFFLNIWPAIFVPSTWVLDRDQNI